jgi:hypothetical protein
MMRMLKGGPNTEQSIQKMSIAVDSDNNMLIVRAPDPLFNEIELLVQNLDQSMAVEPDVTKFVPLKHTNTAAVQRALTSILPNTNSTASSGTDRERRRRGDDDDDDDDSPQERAQRQFRRQMEQIQDFQRMQERFGGGGGRGGGDGDRGGGDRGGGRGFGGRGGFPFGVTAADAVVAEAATETKLGIHRPELAAAATTLRILIRVVAWKKCKTH